MTIVIGSHYKRQKNKIIKAATKGYSCIKVGNLQDDVIKALKDNGNQLYRENIKTDYGCEFLGTLITW